MINDCLRIGFGMPAGDHHAPFRVEPHSSAYQPGLDTTKLNQVLDDLEAEESGRRAGRR